jgi:hypothetical protein
MFRALFAAVALAGCSPTAPAVDGEWVLVLAGGRPLPQSEVDEHGVAHTEQSGRLVLRNDGTWTDTRVGGFIQPNGAVVPYVSSTLGVFTRRGSRVYFMAHGVVRRTAVISAIGLVDADRQEVWSHE